MNVSFDPRARAKHYDRARQYLALRHSPEIANVLERKLRDAPITWHPAADILRAANESPAPLDDPEVQRIAQHLHHGHRMEPILATEVNGKLEIADGSHHASLFAHISPEKKLPVQVAHLNARAT